jgi:hypothetical protein
MARSGTFSRNTTKTAYFRSDADYKSGNDPAASTGITAPGDGVATKGFYVSTDNNATNTLVYVNGKLSGTVGASTTREFVTVSNDGSPSGGRLELVSASGTVTGTFGTLD